MAEPTVPEADIAAEKAYAAAAAEEKAFVDPAPMEFPAKSKRGPKAKPAATAVSDTASIAVIEAKAAALPDPVVPKLSRLPVTAKAARPVKQAAPKPVEPLPAAPEITQPDTAPTEPQVSQLKDHTMATQTTDFTAKEFSGSDTAAKFKDVFADVKTKAKAAFDKGASSLGDVSAFAKGNVEAVVESGKIYAAGLQELGSSYVTESKTAFETLTADAKELAAQKTPVDFFKLQGEIARKNFDNAVSFGTKSSEAWLKLASDAFAPLSSRVNLAVEKIKTAA